MSHPVPEDLRLPVEPGPNYEDRVFDWMKQGMPSITRYTFDSFAGAFGPITEEDENDARRKAAQEKLE